MMHMTFYWSREVTLLFDSWRTRSWTGYALTLLACVIFSAFYQYLENLRVRLNLLSSGRISPSQIELPLLQSKLTGARSRKWLGVRIAGALLFGLNSGIGYLLMLATMSFNGGVFVAVVIGLTIGYFAFRSGDDGTAVVVDNPCACA